jgi:hypothetical protein
MPSFDVVSEVDVQEVRNAVDQANREISTRFDFKGSDARVEHNDARLVVYADDEFKVNQAREVLVAKLAKRKVDIGCLDAGKVEKASGDTARQEIAVRQGIDTDLARLLVKRIKEAKLKVQASIQGDQVRVAGKKRDDLQEVIALLRKGDWGLPLQYVNFRD